MTALTSQEERQNSHSEMPATSRAQIHFTATSVSPLLTKQTFSLPPSVYPTGAQSSKYLRVTISGFPGVAGVKNPPANAGDAKYAGLIPGSGRSPREENSGPLQYSWLENPMGRGTWQATSPWGRKESDTTEHTQHSHTSWKTLDILSLFQMSLIKGTNFLLSAAQKGRGWPPCRTAIAHLLVMLKQGLGEYCRKKK